MSIVCLLNISTHTPARGVTKYGCVAIRPLPISTHTPARGVTDTNMLYLNHQRNFYSHAREGRDTPGGFPPAQILHFYSHAREGRDGASSSPNSQPVISTHTPARGVTAYFAANHWMRSYFYSHAREGRDAPSFRYSTKYYAISTHTPARGVTKRRKLQTETDGISTHTPARGVTGK